MLIVHIIINRIRRFINQRHRYDYPVENNDWKKVGRSPVWGSCETGTMFDPYAYIEDSIIKLVISARKDGSIIIVESIDGIHWENRHTILSGQTDQWDDVVNRGCVVKLKDKYLLWYTGQHNNTSAIGLAISDDGIHYERYSKNPVLSATEIFEGQSIMNPCVIWNDGEHKFQMWYAAGENYEPDVICYAESKDSFNWKKHPHPVLTAYNSHIWEQDKVGGCDVVLNEDGTFVMYYIGYQNVDVARVCYATSQDGIQWSRTDNNLLIAPSKDSWDADAIYKPTVLQLGNQLMMWYNGRKKYGEFIGLAIKHLKK